MQGEIVFIINPISGKRNKGSIRKEIVDALIKERGLKARSVLTEEAKHATDIAREASKYRLTLDDGCVSIDALVLAIANSSQYGSNTYIAPDASLKDGKLNVVAIQSPGFLVTIGLFWRIFSKAI